jgi:hypothetical protein
MRQPGEVSEALPERGPVIVVGSAQSGVAVLRRAPAAGGSVTWIDASALVHLGHQVARIWARAMQHPLSPAAAVAEYWAAHTAALAGFEAAHPDRCLRVRYEDMLADPAEASSVLRDFTGAQSADGMAGMPPAPELVPAELMGRVNDLMTGLGYPALELAPTARRP